MCGFGHQGQCPGCGQRRQVKKAAKRGPVGTGPWGRLPRGVALFCQRTADVFAVITHVIRLGITRGAASIIAEADSFEELRKFPCLGFSQRDGDLDGVHDRLLVGCGPGPTSAARSRVKVCP
jgi:hypothetical protein